MGSITDFISFNQGLNFSAIFACLGIYVVLLWLLISLWVGKDAARRYNNRWAGFVWFLAVFFLSFPALAFYIIVRPDDGERTHANGGLAVPLVNFVGANKEMVFGLELRINPQELTEATKDMKITLDWESKDQNKEMPTETLVLEADATQKRLNGIIAKLTANMRKQGTTLKGLLQKPKKAEVTEKDSSEKNLTEDLVSKDKVVTELQGAVDAILETEKSAPEKTTPHKKHKK